MTIASFDLGGYLGARVRGARAGAGSDEWCLPCPRCGGREHLYVNADKRCGHCFRCGWSPGLLDLLGELEGLPRAEIARRIGEQDEASTLPALAALRQRVLGLGARAMQPHPFASPEMALPDAYVPLAMRHDTTTERALAPFRAYLERRRIPPDATATHRIGCALLGRYEGRVILPVLDSGVVVAYQARDITGRARAKYLGPPGLRLGEVLFNLDLARTHDRIVVCEGIVSALCTGPDAVASFGKTIKPGQLVRLTKARRPVVILFDAAKAATGAADAHVEAEAAASRLHRAGLQAFVARLQAGDPADNPHEVVRAAIETAAPFDPLARVRRQLHAPVRDWVNR